MHGKISVRRGNGASHSFPLSLWHELRVVLHNRENTLVTQMVQAFTREEQDFSERVFNNWVSLTEAVDAMPLE